MASVSGMHIALFALGIVLAFRVRPSVSYDGRRLIGEEFAEMAIDSVSGDIQVDLKHWSHPESPLYVRGRTLTQNVAYAVKKSKLRTAAFQSRMSLRAKAPSNSTYVSPTTSTLGEYVMEFSIGTPARKFVGIADTGSDLVWVQCAPCMSCFTQPDKVFDPTKSKTYKPISCKNKLCNDLESTGCSPDCQYQYSYGDSSSTAGDFAYETLTINTTKGTTAPATNFAFGCATNNQGTFQSADGIVGLGQGPVSFTSQLGALFNNKFSYCFVNFYDSGKQSSPLLFGSSAVPTGPVTYTPIITNPVYPTFYYIGLKGIKVNGVKLPIPAGAFDLDSSGSSGVISDSGTTITMLVSVGYDPLLKKIKSLVKYPVADGSAVGLDLCFDMAKVKDATFPTITFDFDGLTLDLPAENSFLLVDNIGTTCFAYASSGSPFSIFGNVQQQNFQILHDRQTKRFGFSKVQCDKLSRKS